MKRTGNSNTRRENIESGHRDGIWHRKICYPCNEKRQTILDGRNGTTKSRKIRKLIYTSYDNSPNICLSVELDSAISDSISTKLPDFVKVIQRKNSIILGDPKLTGI